MDALSRHPLIDKLIEAYVDWHEACARVSETYRSWASETGPDGRLSFGLYMAALDAEARAAEVYARLVQRADKLARSGGAPAAEPPIHGRWRG